MWEEVTVFEEILAAALIYAFVWYLCIIVLRRANLTQHNRMPAAVCFFLHCLISSSQPPPFTPRRLWLLPLAEEGKRVRKRDRVKTVITLLCLLRLFCQPNDRRHLRHLQGAFF